MSEEKSGFTEEQARKLIEDKNKADCDGCMEEIKAVLAKWGCDMGVLETRLNGSTINVQYVIDKKKA